METRNTNAGGEPKKKTSFFKKIGGWIKNHPILSGVIIGTLIGVSVFIPPLAVLLELLLGRH